MSSDGTPETPSASPPQGGVSGLGRPGAGRGQPEMLARIQADADRNIRRFKLLADDEVVDQKVTS